MRVLVVEDDAELAETVAVGLRRRQLAVDVALDGRSGLDRAFFTNYDVIVCSTGICPACMATRYVPRSLPRGAGPRYSC